MRGEWGLIAGVVAAVLVHPVAECSLVHAEFPCDLGDRAGSVDHQSPRLIPALRTELAVLPCHSLHHLPGQILLDHGPRTTGHLISTVEPGSTAVAWRLAATTEVTTNTVPSTAV